VVQKLGPVTNVKDSKLGKDTSLGPDVMSVANATAVIRSPDGSVSRGGTGGNQLGVAVLPISPNNDFGKAGQKGSGTLVFTVRDAKGNTYTGSVSASVTQKVEQRNPNETTGHDRGQLPSNRTTFNVPQ
jgi:hypothetical protein